MRATVKGATNVRQRRVISGLVRRTKLTLLIWLAREVELSREEPAAGPLHLKMIVLGAPRIGGRNNCVEPPTTLVIHLLMATKPESDIVISADVIGMPDLEE